MCVCVCVGGCVAHVQGACLDACTKGQFEAMNGANITMQI